MKKIIIFFVCAAFTTHILYAEQFSGESSLITSSGLIDRYDPKDPETYKKVFGERVKTIKYWVDFSKDTGGMGSIQSVEWFSPEGELWFKETNDVFDVASPFRPKVLERIYSLDTKGISSGVWAVRFIWNDNVIEQRYFSYGTNKEPSETETANLNNQIQKHDEVARLTDKSYDFKLTSYLLHNFDHYFGQQRIYQPTFCISPVEKISYLLNVYGGDMVLSPAVFLYIFSPDGKVYTNDRLSISRASGSINYYARFKKDIRLETEKNGIWKLIVYYADDDKVIDEKFFYVGNSKDMLLTKETIDGLESKIDKNSVFDMLPDYVKNDVTKYRKSSQKRIMLKLKNGMTKEDVLRLLGQPSKIDTGKYDDAVVWIYDDVEKSVGNAIRDSEADYQILHGTGNVGRDLIGGVVYTIISAGVGAATTNKLELVIKDGKVIGKRGSI